MLVHLRSRRSAAFLAAWFAVSVSLWAGARLGFGARDEPARAWRALPGNAAALAIAPASVATRRWFSRERSFVVASVLSGAGWTGVACVVGALWKRSGRKRPGCTDLSRRAFLARVGASGTTLGAAGTIAKATVVDPLDIRVVRYTVPITNLPRALDGMRIAHLTDWHVGSRVPLEVLEASTRLALELKPDLIALTGDYVHSNVGQLDALRRVLAPLVAPGAARYGVVGVLGNHDYYAGAEEVAGALREMGVSMIDNDRLFLMPDGITGASGEALCVAGLADPWMDVPVQERALGGVAHRTPRVVLCHQPDVAEHFGWRAPWAPRADLMLSGHTHGGQVRVPFLGTPIVPSHYGQRYAGGLVEGPHFPVIVSRGIGMSLLPIRFGVPPEVGEITLVRA